MNLIKLNRGHLLINRDAIASVEISIDGELPLISVEMVSGKTRLVADSDARAVLDALDHKPITTPKAPLEIRLQEPHTNRRRQ